MGTLDTRSGFTIVELLVVVAVITILSLITVIAYTSIVANTKAAAVETGLKQIEEGMRTWMTEESHTQWTYDPTVGGGVPLSKLINDNPGLKMHLQEVPSVKGVQNSEWFYDNDRDTKPTCGGIYDGVNIVIRGMTSQSLAQKIDNDIDDGNLNCGRIRYVDERLFYSLSYNQNIDL